MMRKNNNIKNINSARANRTSSKKKSNELEDNTKQIKPKNASNGMYYSFLTIILLLCLIQISISAILNISKIISYKAKIVQITKTRDSAQNLNEQLKDNIKNFSDINGLEAIARNNLKMSSEDEVLVIINHPKKTELKDEKITGISFKKNNDATSN